MSRLTIVQINSELPPQTLEEIADNIYANFPQYNRCHIALTERINLYPATNPCFFVCVPDNLIKCLQETRPDLSVYSPNVHALSATRRDEQGIDYYLGKRFNTDVLAITSEFLLNSDGEPDLMYGAFMDKSNTRVCIVSTAFFRIENQSPFPQHICTESIHELGHLNGLSHHALLNPNRKYCPMIEAVKINRLKKLLPYSPDTFNYRDTTLCNECKTKLTKLL